MQNPTILLGAIFFSTPRNPLSNPRSLFGSTFHHLLPCAIYTPSRRCTPCNLQRIVRFFSPPIVDQLCHILDAILAKLGSIMPRSSRLVRPASRRIMCKSGSIMAYYTESMPRKGCCSSHDRRFTAHARLCICIWPRCFSS